MKVLTVVGARPQFVKSAVVSRALAAKAGVEELILHTGQHYDDALSDSFFRDLEIPRPYKNLNVGSDRHGAQTAAMLAGIEAEILSVRPDWLLIYGDTNSTLAAALAASKVGLPVAHVEAGLRSFNRSMPEEVNRVVADHLSTKLFCPTRTALANLTREGIERGVELVGDVMYDAALLFGDRARRCSKILELLRLDGEGYVLATVHRAENTDEPSRLAAILTALGDVAARTPVVLPLHPRTRGKIVEHGLEAMLAPLRVTNPLGFFDMLALVRAAAAILTDSGGVQKEAYFFRRPCVTMRDETEWVETVEAGWNVVVGSNAAKIVAGALAAAAGKKGRDIADYGDGDAGRRIAASLS
jgi:UDP-GlcNAc3NAcA epimerase